MKNKHRYWLMAFFAVSMLELWAEMAANTTLRNWTKPLLMPVLGIWFALETAHIRKFARNTILSALVFSTLGDVLLMFAGGPSGPLFFLLGLGAFLFAHFFYTGYFFSKDKRQNGFLKKNPLWVIPSLLYMVALLWWLWSDVPQAMRLPVVFYAFTITAMTLSVINLRGQVNSAVHNQLLTGAFLFLISDSILAINKFGHSFNGARMLIMVTYILGQYFLVSGARKTH